MEIRMGVLYATMDAQTVYVRSIDGQHRLIVWRIDNDGVHRPHGVMDRPDFANMLPGQGRAMPQYLFDPGTQYLAKNGDYLFVMSGCNDTLDVWRVHGPGQHTSVGLMSADALAGLLVSPPKESV